MSTPTGPVDAGTTLTIAEAAAVCGVDESTIKRDRRADRYPGAAQDATLLATWRIPVEDLVAAGRLAAGQVREVREELAARRESRELGELRLQVARLETELAEKSALLAERAADIAFLRQQLARSTKAVA